MARRLAGEEGLFVGVSAGAAAVAALDVAEQLESGTVVAILPDGGARYASDPFWAAGAAAARER
jgi:cysteine synthase